MDIQDINKQKEIVDFVKAYSKLVAQYKKPSRGGMIDALKEAMKVAQSEIRNVEISRGETTPTPWEQIPDSVLYAKLSEYQQAMYQHAVNKFGEEEIEKWLKQNMQ